MRVKIKETLKKLYRYASPMGKIGAVFLLAGVLFQILCNCFTPFADFINYWVGGVIRMVLSFLTGWLPNSVAECALLALPLILTVLIVLAFRAAETNRRAWHYMSTLLGIMFAVYFCFVSCFLSAYHGTGLDKRFGLTEKEVSAEELYETLLWTIDETNQAAQKIDFIYGSSSVMHDTYSQMNKKIMKAYDALHEDYPFFIQYPSRTKPVIMSDAMSYTHMTGIYTFFTGEANINTAFPDYTIPFTAAHELAHQRGIIRENEANFMAFMTLIRSDDAYLTYSAYLNLYEYLASALYDADYALFAKAYSQLDLSVRYEIQAYNAFFQKYENNTAASVTEKLNDTYLKANGQSAGSQSYGLVVDLAVAYYYDKIA